MRRQLPMLLGFLVMLIISTPVWAQNPITMDSPFQIRYAANLNLADSVVNMTNSGASNENICVNVYAFAPDEQLVSCCTCPLSPNSIKSLSARNDLIANTLTPAVPSAITIKLLATTGGTCNAANPGALAVGLLAWGSTVHGTTTRTTVSNTSANCVRYCSGTIPSYYASWCAANCAPTTVETTTLATTETPFLPATLSAGELTRLTDLCGDIQQNGSGFGICRACRIGGL